MASVPMVIDADPGTDDAVAILIALGSPGLQVRGITTVGGNASLEITTDNVLRLVAAVNCDVPVFAGAAAPLSTACRYGTGPLARTGRKAEGGDGLGLPEAARHVQGQPAADFLIDTFTGPAGEDTVLVATGPLTNVASAILREPRLKRAIRRLVLMGGSRGPGNATASADFNFWADPEAAQAVLHAGIPDVLIFPLDVTKSARLGEPDCAQIEKSGPTGALAARLIRYRMTAGTPDQPTGGAGRSAAVHDAFCTAHLVAPVVTGSERCAVTVDTSSGAARGTSAMIPVTTAGVPGNSAVVLGARPGILTRTIAAATRHLPAAAGLA